MVASHVLLLLCKRAALVSVGHIHSSRLDTSIRHVLSMIVRDTATGERAQGDVKLEVQLAIMMYRVLSHRIKKHPDESDWAWSSPLGPFEGADSVRSYSPVTQATACNNNLALWDGSPADEC